jgi:arylformamidase
MKPLPQTSSIDISRRISPEAVSYGDGEPLGMKPVCSVGVNGSNWSITKLDWTTHFLTHVDPPAHHIPGGATLDQVPVARFMGPAIVVEAKGDAVEASDVPGEIAGLNILFKTRNSSVATNAPFARDYVYISAAAAQALVRERVNLVGIDYLSVDPFGAESFPAHTALLGNDILILEGADLSSVSPGRYHLVALPLRIAEGDGSPVRAVLFPE